MQAQEAYSESMRLWAVSEAYRDNCRLKALAEKFGDLINPTV